MHEKRNILFLDTYNVSRSIVAESYMRKHGSDRFNVYSAGVYNGKRNERFKTIYNNNLEVISELMLPVVGLKYLKSVDKYLNVHFDYIITLSERARIECPMFIGSTIKTHWNFNFEEIPSPKTEKEKMLERLRIIRHEVISKVDKFVHSFMIAV